MCVPASLFAGFLPGRLERDETGNVLKLEAHAKKKEVFWAFLHQFHLLVRSYCVIPFFMKSNILKAMVVAACAALFVVAGQASAAVQVNVTVGAPCVHAPVNPPLCQPCRPHVIHLGPHHHHCHHPRHVHPQRVHVHRPAPPHHVHVHRPAPPHPRHSQHIHKPGVAPHRR